MRLLHTTRLTLEQFGDSVIPSYVILSHTWGEDEVTYSELASPTARFKKGYQKILGCCKLARCDGYDWIWVDTCCIDKSSSAELSEAINSMYRWYAEADLCYVYLADIDDSAPQTAYRRGLRDSRWFTRGWTLQELIAPKIVEFYDANWQEVGTKTSMKETLHEITGIDLQVLEGKSPSVCNVAERMSWAFLRRTTRQEDMAYSLLGLFGINMPLLYGEGPHAFRRLQEEILKTSTDYALFAWKGSSFSRSGHGVLSPSIGSFQRPGRDLYRFPRWSYKDLRRQSFPREQSSTAHWSNAFNKDLPVLMSGCLRLRLPVTEMIVERLGCFPDTWLSRTALAYLGYVEVKSGSLLCIKLRPVEESDIGSALCRHSLELLPASRMSSFTLATVTLIAWHSISTAPRLAMSPSFDWFPYHAFCLGTLPSCISATSKYLSSTQADTANAHTFPVGSESEPTELDQSSLQHDTMLYLAEGLWGHVTFCHRHDRRMETVAVRFGSTSDAVGCQIGSKKDLVGDHPEWHHFAYAPVQGFSYQSFALDGSGRRQICARIKRLPGADLKPPRWVIRITCEALAPVAHYHQTPWKPSPTKAEPNTSRDTWLQRFVQLRSAPTTAVSQSGSM